MKESIFETHPQSHQDASLFHHVRHSSTNVCHPTVCGLEITVEKVYASMDVGDKYSSG
jgi:hypothetical protein